MALSRYRYPAIDSRRGGARRGRKQHPGRVYSPHPCSHFEIETEAMPMKRNGICPATVAIVVICGGLAASCERMSTDVFYAIAEAPASPKLIRIETRGVNQVAVTTVGGTG